MTTNFDTNIDSCHLLVILEQQFEHGNIIYLKQIVGLLLKEQKHLFLAYIYQAKLLELDGNSLEADKHFVDAYKIDDKNIFLLNEYALFKYRIGQMKLAKQLLLKSLKINTNDFSSNFNMGLMLHKIKNYKLAEIYIKKCLDIDVNALNASILLADILLRLEKFDQCRLLVEKNFKYHQLNFENNKLLLELNKRQKNDKNQNICKAILAISNNAAIYTTLTMILFNIRELEICTQLCEEGLKKYPNDHNLLNNAAHCALYMHDKNKFNLYVNKLKTQGIEIDSFHQGQKILEANLPDMRVQVGEDKERIFNGSWYRGRHTNFQPSKRNLSENSAILNYVLKGFVPETPFITRKSNITTFGSCFAQNVTAYLVDKGYSVMGKDMQINSHVVRCGEGMVNTFAILQQFEWAYENKKFSENLWYGSQKEILSYDDKIRRQTKKMFEHSDVFIITLGLSEIWYNKNSQEVFWRAIPQNQFNEKIHGFRISTVDENKKNIIKICNIIKKYRLNAKIIFTLSPIPLNATFRNMSCITANSVSKAILRAAIDEAIIQQKLSDVFYFPSYEIVKDYFIDPYDEDNRHVKKEKIITIMQQFEQYFCS